MPDANAASFAFSTGTSIRFMPWSRAYIATANTPWMGRTCPLIANSPMIIALSNPEQANCPSACNTPNAIGKSYALPLLCKSAGARFTIALPNGIRYPELCTAPRTRSRLSRIAMSGSPTTIIDGPF